MSERKEKKSIEKEEPAAGIPPKKVSAAGADEIPAKEDPAVKADRISAKENHADSPDRILTNDHSKDSPAADHNRQKKIAVINDFTGFGRCSLAVSIPVISKLRIQCCPVPTAILSDHTGFASFFMEDFTPHLDAYTNEWKKLGLRFNGISTGYLGSAAQFSLVHSFIRDFRTEETIVSVDPVMGDYGALYPGYGFEMCEEMKSLVREADIITPNLTEACLLTDTDYHEGHWHLEELERLIRKLEEAGADRIVITGIPQGEFIANLSFRKGSDLKLTRQYRVGEQRSGTGDVFSSIIIADAVNGVPFEDSVRRASRFVKKCIMKSMEMNIPVTDGVAFEEVLDSLHV